MKILKNDRLEIRRGYFLKGFSRTEEEMATISFGACNFQCPYCKRDCQYINADGTVIKTKDITMKELKELIDNELKEIGKILEKYPNVFWTLRKYNEVKGCDFEVPTMDFVTNIAIELKKEFPNLKIGTRNYWKGGFEIL